LGDGRIPRFDPGGLGCGGRLKLLGGRILAQVQKLNESRSTFEVEAGGVVCGVRGTAFEVDLRGDDLETRTQEGEVEVTSGGKTESVRAGNAFAYRRGLLRMRRRLDRAEINRFTEFKKIRTLLREKRLKRLHNLLKKKRPGLLHRRFRR
jgi:ferric-dicitrate binding protein FerR (iron transport regulator)